MCLYPPRGSNPPPQDRRGAVYTLCYDELLPHSGIYIQYINATSPHASPLRRLGLSTRNRARTASHSSTGGSSLDSED